MKNLTKTQPQPKTVISLNTLGAGKRPSKSVGDTPLILEDSTARGNSSYSAPDAESSTDSQSGSSPGSPRRATTSAFFEDSSRTIAMPAMMTETAVVDERIVAMERAISKLTKTVEENDLQIATLMNKLEVHNHGESPFTSVPPKMVIRELRTNIRTLPPSPSCQFSSCTT